MAVYGWVDVIPLLTCFFALFLCTCLSNNTVMEHGSENVLCERRLLLSNPPRWNRTITRNCTSKSGSGYPSETIRVYPNKVEIVDICDTNECNSEDDWFTKYCPQLFNVKVPWYLQSSKRSFVTCSCNVCPLNVCYSGNGNYCTSERNGPKNISLTCLPLSDVKIVLESAKVSIYESEYQHQEMACKFSDYCNTFSISEIKEFVCPALLVDELRLFDPQNFLHSDETDQRQCDSDEWNGPKCLLSSAKGFCFKYLIKFIRRPAVDVYKSEGCDENTENKTTFDMQRSIYLFTTGRIVVKWECANPNCMTDYNQLKLFQCLNGVNQSVLQYQTFRQRKGICRCTPESMGPDLVQFCVGGLCYRERIVEKNEMYSQQSFFCFNFGEDRYGCYFNNSQPFGLLYLDVLTYSGKTKTRRMLCATSKCNKGQSINAISGCQDSDDQLFGPTEDPYVPSTKVPRILATVDPNDILGPVGAIVVIFLTLVIAVVLVINLATIFRIELKWRFIDKSAEKRQLEDEKRRLELEKCKFDREKSIRESIRSDPNRSERKDLKMASDRSAVDIKSSRKTLKL